MHEDDLTCVICSATREAAQLHRCRICRQFYCAECTFRARGGVFCSRECANMFFFGDEEDEPTESDE